MIIAILTILVGLFVQPVVSISQSIQKDDVVTLSRIVIFYSPHQDDETLSMGNVIAGMVEDGFDVHVVLVTDGAASKARTASQSRVAFSSARTREFVKAVKRLGVTNPIGSEGLADGKLTVAQAAGVIAKWEALYPGALHITESAIDRHPDHRALGVALEQSGLRAGWVVFRPYWGNLTENCHWVDQGVPQVLHAAKAYVIGNRSVPKYFAALRRDPKDMLCLSARP